MKNFRGLLFGAMTLLLAGTAAGCGTNGLPTAQAPAAKGFQPGTITAAGVSHTLGYDMNRYETVLAPKARKQHMIRQGLLPTAIDSREACSPVVDQGKLGSCTAFAMGKGLREYMQRKNTERQVPLSGLFLYYAEREQMGTINSDSGATITDGMRVLSRTGIATEENCPYDIAQFKVKPSQAAYASAGEFKIHDALELDTFSDVKAALAKGQTVAFGFRVYESFRKIGADGVMPVPASGEKLLGGHAVLAVGYDDAKKSLIVRNSWGEKWGDKGYFYMPYDVAGSHAARDFWTASK